MAKKDQSRGVNRVDELLFGEKPKQEKPPETPPDEPDQPGTDESAPEQGSDPSQEMLGLTDDSTASRQFSITVPPWNPDDPEKSKMTFSMTRENLDALEKVKREAIYWYNLEIDKSKVMNLALQRALKDIATHRGQSEFLRKCSKE